MDGAAEMNQTAEVSPKRAFLGYAATLLPLVLAPRGTAPVLVMLWLAALYGMRVRGELTAIWRRPEPIVTAILAFVLWSMVTAVWAPAPIETLGKCAALAAVTVLAATTVHSAARTSRPVATAAAAALIVAFAAGAALASFEVLTDQYLLRSYYNAFPTAVARDLKHLRFEHETVVLVSEIFINRGVFLLTLLAVPVWIGASALPRHEWRGPVRGLVVFYLVVMTVFSMHESSKLAALAGGAILALSFVSMRRATQIAMAAWMSLVLLAVPIALTMSWARLDEAAWLPHSARDRIKIWSHTAKQTLVEPVFGHGANATAPLNARAFAKYVSRVERIDPKRAESYAKQMAYAYQSGERLGPHAHNVYLQTWFETGLIGALAVGVIGAAVLMRLRRMPEAGARPLLVQFTLVAAGLATSYGMWQLWLQAGIAISLAMIVISLRATGVELRAAPASSARR